MILTHSEFKFIDRHFKDVLLLIPGWATDYRIFSSLDLNYNYLLPVNFSCTNFAKDLSGELDKRGIEKIFILGWSLGGFLAYDFALENPERVKGLSLLSICRGFNQAILENARSGIKRNKRAFLYKFYLDGFSKSDREGVNWFRNYLLNDYLQGMESQQLLAGLDYLYRARIIPESLARIKGVRVYHGEDDLIVPLKEACQVSPFLEKGAFICLSGLGHALFLNHRFKEKFQYGQRNLNQ